MKLSMAQEKVLKVLDGKKGLTAAEVAKKTHSKAGPMMRSLLVLELLGLAKASGQESLKWKRTGAGTKELKKL